MPRERWILDPETGDLVPAAEYGQRLEQRRGRCRTGSPVVIADWAEPVRSPVDGTMMRSRADMREMCRRNDVRPAGETGYLEGMKRVEPKGTDFKPLLHGVLCGDIPVDPKAKALVEGRLPDTPPPPKAPEAV